MKSKLSILILLIAGVMFIASAQTRSITGKVTDSSGQPIVGVSISAKGSHAATTTGREGFYKITITSADKTLQFSFLGFVTVTEKIGDRQIINITMKEDQPALNEMVVIGYGTKKSHAGKTYGVAAPSYISYASEQPMPRVKRDFNTEGYAGREENGFKSVKNNPLSTFSIDVDNASYSNIRRFINTGTLPPPEAVRIEEMINYFKYDYPEPGGVHPFSVYSELSACPWNSRHQLFMVGLKGKSIDKSSLPASNLVFLIDVSGSMDAPNKLPLLKSAFGLLVNELRPEDHIAIVVYAGAAGVVLPSTPGNKKDLIMNAINNLEAGGSTAGGAGLRLAYSIASEHFIKGGANRVILATDGEFSEKNVSDGYYQQFITGYAAKGIKLSILGFGVNEEAISRMKKMAAYGEGSYIHIDSEKYIKDVLINEIRSMSFMGD